MSRPCSSCHATGLSTRALAYAEDPTNPTAKERYRAACALDDDRLYCPECHGEAELPWLCEGCGEVVPVAGLCPACASAPQPSPADWLSLPGGVVLASLAAARRYPELCRIVGMALACGVVAGPRVVTTSGVEIKEVA